MRSAPKDIPDTESLQTRGAFGNIDPYPGKKSVSLKGPPAEISEE